MKQILLMMLGIMLLLSNGNDAKKVAVVKMLKGKVFVVDASGNKSQLKKGDWLKEGAVVKTESASFVKLSFIDKSSMNVGPKSEMKIEKFSKQEAGVIDVIGGKIRAQVTKDYLEMDKDKSKLFVKSKSAVMGVRGTDFMFTTNKKTGNTTTVLFEGKIMFNKFDKKSNNLEEMVSRGRTIKPGQFSVVSKDLQKPTVPAKMSTKQINKLMKNETLSQNSKTSVKKEIVPPGLSAEDVASESTEMKDAIKEVMNSPEFEETIAKVETKKKEAPTEESKGFVKGADAKPADGSLVDINSGTIIPLPKDSKFDDKSGEWVSSSAGSVKADGSYAPPEGFAMTDTGDMLKEVAPGKVEKVVLKPVQSLDDTLPLNEMPSVAVKIKDLPKEGDKKNRIAGNDRGEASEEGGDDFGGREPASIEIVEEAAGPDGDINGPAFNNQMDANRPPCPEPCIVNMPLNRPIDPATSVTPVASPPPTQRRRDKTNVNIRVR